MVEVLTREFPAKRHRAREERPIGAVALVRLVVGFNLAHLFLARSWERAVGARPGGGVGRMGREMIPIALGLAAGLAGALYAGRVLSGFLYRMSPSDPPTLVAVVITLLVASILAPLVPATRALRVDPAEALRAE